MNISLKLYLLWTRFLKDSTYLDIISDNWIKTFLATEPQLVIVGRLKECENNSASPILIILLICPSNPPQPNFQVTIGQGVARMKVLGGPR